MNALKQLDRHLLIESIGLGIAQIMLWGGSYFLLAILAKPIMAELKWSNEFVYGALSFSILISGLVSPKIGHLINTKSRNYVVLLSGLLMGIGLICLGLSTNKGLFIFGWILIGFAMGAGLYDPLFASLGRKYGKKATNSIVQITLVSGFTTTTIWPILSYLLNTFGWRSTCFIYAISLIVLIFPIHYFSIFKFQPKQTNFIEKELTSIKEVQPKTAFKKDKIFYLLLFNFSIGSVLMTGIYLHLIDILLSHKITMIQAISIGAMLGPAQVGIRILDIVLPKKTPDKTAIISGITILIGLILLLISAKVAFLGVVFFGLGNGMRSILRGTLPLWIYGQESYAEIIGKLARLPLLAQALTPFLSGLIINYFEVDSLLNILCILAFINVIPMIILYKLCANKHEKQAEI